MKISDRIIGIFLLMFSVAIWLQARSFPMIPGQSIGSGLMPTIVSFGLAVCAVTLIFKDLAKKPRTPLAEAGDWVSDPRRQLRVAIALIGTTSFIFFMDVVGFPLLSIIVLLAFLLSLRVAIGTALLISVIASMTIHVLFNKVFLVPLPWGLLQPIAW